MVGSIFINEFHYDNAGGDVGEFVEIAAPAGTDLSGYSIVLYNGSGGAVYGTLALSGIVPSQQNGYGTISFAYPVNGLQNGAPDGIALVGPGNVVLEFLSYEGSFTAVGGAANGMVSTDVGVFEPGDAAGTSIARTGTGDIGDEFAWTVGSASAGAVNTGQSFPAPPSSVSVSDATIIEGDAGETLASFTLTRTGGTAAFTVDYATSDSTATAGSDYIATSTVASFAANQNSVTVTVAVTGDTAFELDEAFFLTLSNATGGVTIGDGQGIGTITNDDLAPPVANAWINEFHYDDDSVDTGEFIEIAGAAGTDLTGYSLVLYNGNGNAAYNTRALAGVITDQQGGYGTISFAYPQDGIQNGAPDGIALVKNGTVVEFISYEGTMTAVGGPAAGMTSTDVGVFEPGTGIGTSIGRIGTGDEASDFTWALNADDTPGAANTGQTFGTPAASVSIGDFSLTEGDAGTTLATFTVTRANGGGAFSVDYTTADNSAAAGSDYVAISGTLDFAATETSKTFQVVVNGDTDVELDESFFVTLSNATNGLVIADGQGTGTIANDDVSTDLTLISEIQGSAHFSPLLVAEGITQYNVRSFTQVTIRGVVTATDGNGARQGFFVMEEEGDWDVSGLTSEGIFVMTRDDTSAGSTLASAAPGLTIGETVTVTAFVMEYAAFDNLPRTMLVSPSIITQSNLGTTIPSYVLDGSAGRQIPNSVLTNEVPDLLDSGSGTNFDPAVDALDFFETIEGMKVTIPDMIVADGFISGSNDFVRFKAYSTVHADADQINSRGGYTIAGDPPFSDPDTADAEDDTIRGGAHLHDGDVNPDVIELDFGEAGRGGTAGFHEKLSMGDGLGTVSGVIDFDFENLKLYVTDPVTLTDRQPAQETTALERQARSLTVATFNVENLDAAEGDARFAELAQAIAVNLKAPDILSIEEIQDNNGAGAGDGISPTGTDASQTWQKLADAVSLATGDLYQWVDEAPAIYNTVGGEPNGNIRVGFLYNTSRVQLGDLAADATIEQRRAYVDRIGDGTRDAGDLIAFDDSMIAGEINTADWDGTRRSLLGQFTFNGATVYATANHWPSKGGSGSFWEINQDIDAGTPANGSWAKRNELAQDMWSMLDTISTADADNRVLAGGDFNDFYFYRPLEIVTGAVNLDGTARSGGTRYDNLTVTELSEAERYTYEFDGRSQAIDHIIADKALSAVADYDVVHINTGYNGRTGGNNPALSDHDPALARFDFRDFAETLAGGALADALLGFGGDDTLAGNGGDDDLTGGKGDDALTGGEGSDTALFTGALGDYVIVRNDDGSVTITDGTADRDGIDTLTEIELVDFAGTVVELAALLNRAPTATDDAVAINEDATSANLWTTLLANDSDPDAGDSLTISAIDTTGTLGSVQFDAASQSLRYVADADAFDALATGATAADSFRYTITDEQGETSTATVSLTITGIADGVTRYGTIFRDTLNGTGGEDTLYGLFGNDTLNGLAGNDMLWGGLGNDALNGGDGADKLSGGIGNDTLVGGAGADRLSADFGDDTLTGGSGADRFAFGLLGGSDTITDFEVALDKIVLGAGINVTKNKVKDVNRDGIADLTLSFTLGGTATLLGVSDFSKVMFERDPSALFSETLF